MLSGIALNLERAAPRITYQLFIANHQPTKGASMTIVGILIVIILVLLAIYLFRRIA